MRNAEAKGGSRAQLSLNGTARAASLSELSIGGVTPICLVSKEYRLERSMACVMIVPLSYGLYTSALIERCIRLVELRSLGRPISIDSQRTGLAVCPSGPHTGEAHTLADGQQSPRLDLTPLTRAHDTGEQCMLISMVDIETIYNAWHHDL
jgi:hypothetical protein